MDNFNNTWSNIGEIEAYLRPSLADTIEQLIPVLIEVATFVAAIGAAVEVKKYMDMKWHQVFFLFFKSRKQFIKAMRIRHKHDTLGKLISHLKPIAQKG